MLRTILRVLSAGLAAQGAFMVWIARYGTLWQYETDLGWFAPYVLRPGMYAIGAFSVVLGLWYAWLGYTLAGRVLGQWADDVRHDLAAGAVADLGWPTVLRSYSRELWDRRGCVIGRHDMDALNYFPGEGTICEDCGLVVRLRLGWRDRLWLLMNREDKVQARWRAHLDKLVPPLEVLSQEESDRMVYGEPYPGLEPQPVEGCHCARCEDLRAEKADTIMVLHPDGQRRPEDAPSDRFTVPEDQPSDRFTVPEDQPSDRFTTDDGCFTQGSDAVVRQSRCDKEG